MSNKPDLSGLSEKEKQEVLKILEQFSNDGKSEIFNNILYQDYEEIPVDITTFLHNPHYLGKGLTDAEGRFTLFPYWEDLLKRMYPDPLKPAICNTLALTGGIGLGKSTIMVITGCYELYRMLCLKDPYIYYGLQPIDLITFAVININIKAAQGVAWSKLQSLIQSSDWFMSRGTVNKANTPEWVPPKGIELIYGSRPSHIIGRALFWCLDGDTIIKTADGDVKLRDLTGKNFQVISIDNNGNEVVSDFCTAKETIISTEQIEIELEDSTVIKCTPNHRFMLKDGTYKEAQYLTEEDELFNCEPVGYIYKTTNKVNGHIYIGKCQSKKIKPNYLGSGKRLKREVKKYGRGSFEQEILCWAVSNDDLCLLEEFYIDKYFDLKNCINIKKESIGGITTKGTHKYTDGVNEFNIDDSLEIPKGLIRGSKPTRKSNPWNKGLAGTTVTKKLGRNVAGDRNPMYGNGHKLSGGKNGHAIYIYTFEGVDYDCRDDLMIILKKKYPNISESTIRKIQSNNYGKRILKNYSYVIDNLSWRLKEKYENKVN